jgi:immune inhibitor A
VNFGPYDNDGDGDIEALIIICAGSGAETTGNKNDLWSHKWGIRPKTLDGKRAISYFMAPEDGRVGVMAHELGHLLMGWPDLYDTDYSSAGTGAWDLMAGGSWNNNGNTPAHPTAWCKSKVGWLTPTVVFNAEQAVTLGAYAKQAQVYKLPVGSVSSKEYFLVSNRQQTGFDAHLPGAGVIIEHVDDDQANNTDEDHYLVDIEQADGQRHLNTNPNRGDSSDAFPTASNNAFTRDSTPNSRSYSAADSKVSVTEITRLSADKVSAKIKVGTGVTKSWHYNLVPQYTYTTHASQVAYVYLVDMGWRRIKTGSTDGVTNMFAACCEALANGKKLHVYADADYVYNLYLV